MTVLRLIRRVLHDRSESFHEPRHVVHHLDLLDVEQSLAALSITHTSCTQSFLVTVKPVQGIPEIAKCIRRVTFILREVNEVEECTERGHDTWVDRFVTGNDANEDTLDVTLFPACVLLESGETISKMSRTDPFLQHRYSLVDFSISNKLSRPFDRMVQEHAMQLMEGIGG